MPEQKHQDNVENKKLNDLIKRLFIFKKMDIEE
jgi:hypothetical protein